MHIRTGVTPVSSENRLGMAYRQEVANLPWTARIWDAHVHLHDVAAARQFFEVADLFGVERVWSMSPLQYVDEISDLFGDRVRFIAVPNYKAHNQPGTFTTDWLKRIEGFAAKGCRVCKFWAAPRGRDIHPSLRLDSPTRQEAMRLAKSLGMKFMVHIADPDTWFATHYRDHHRYGRKSEHHVIFERLLDEYHDVTWIAAHMAGDPEHLDHLQDLLDRHPNLYLDTAATKWMVRELSKHPQQFRAFCQHNAGRILFGSDIVADSDNISFDLLASRYWALRTLLETDYEGPSPIEDPDLRLVDPSLPIGSAPTLRGAHLDPATLAMVYRGAAARLHSNESP